MAKELPYFKFEPAEYITKDIAFCSYAAQGLFINLCSHYWQRNCEMTLQQAKRRFKDDELINELIDEEIIHLDGENIIIRFLISQRDEAITKSNVNKANGSKGGRPKKSKQNQKETENKPNALGSLSETKGIREDNIREDNIREDEIKEDKIINNEKFVKDAINSEQWIETVAMNTKTSLDVVKLYLKHFESHLIAMEEQKKSSKDFKSHFVHWLNKQDLSQHRTKKIGRSNQINYGN